jgi:hypothetical protein
MTDHDKELIRHLVELQSRADAADLLIDILARKAGLRNVQDARDKLVAHCRHKRLMALESAAPDLAADFDTLPAEALDLSLLDGLDSEE